MDIINVEILEDGTLRIETESISQVNHISADNFLDMLEDMIGKKTSEKKKENAFWKNKTVLKGGKIINKT